MERFKRKLIAGIICFGIGIALISWGVFIWNFAPRSFVILLLVIGGILFIAGVGLLIHSLVLKRSMEKLEKIDSMKKPEEIRKIEREAEEKRIAYNRALTIGISLVGPGVVFFLLGIILWGDYTFVGLGGVLFLFGVWYLVDSIRIKKSIKKLEKSERDIGDSYGKERKN